MILEYIPKMRYMSISRNEIYYNTYNNGGKGSECDAAERLA